MSNAIEMRGVAWRPDVSFALDDLSLAVPQGAIYGFLGANGSGKSSTIRILMGMMKPDRGDIRMLGRPVPDDLPVVLHDVGYMPERPHLYRHLTVQEVVDFHRSFHPGFDRELVSDLLDRLELSRHMPIKRLSKGQTGKLMFTLALSNRPRLLVLDEPTDGLDPVVRRDIMTTMVDYVSQSGATVFISSHLVHELERICDWVGVIDRGRMVAELRMEDFKRTIKRVRLDGEPELSGSDVPFAILDRSAPNGLSPHETWVVWGWEQDHHTHLMERGVQVRDVVDLDLEEGFVALLRATRTRGLER